MGLPFLTSNGMQWTAYDPPVFLILEERQGRFWLGCGGGILYQGLFNLEALRQGQHRRLHTLRRLWYHGGRSGPTVDNVGEVFRRAGRDYLDQVSVWGVPCRWCSKSPTSRGDLWIPSRDGLYRWHQSDLPTAIGSSAMPV